MVLSSTKRSLGEHADKAVDNASASQWASEDASYKWLWVDLLDFYEMTQVVLLWGDKCPEQYWLQRSPDGLGWTNMTGVKATGVAGPVTADIPNLVTQWVRVVCKTPCSIPHLPEG